MFSSLKKGICRFKVLCHITVNLIKYYNKTVIQVVLFNLVSYYMLFNYIFKLNLDGLFLKSMLCSLLYIIIISFNATVLYSLVKSYFNMTPIDFGTVVNFANKNFIKLLICNMFYLLSIAITIYVMCFFYLSDDKTNADNIRIMCVVAVFQVIPLVIYFKTMFVNCFISVFDLKIFKAINKNLELSKGKKMILGIFSYLFIILVIILNYFIIARYRGNIWIVFGSVLNSLSYIFITIYNAYLCVNLNYVFSLPENDYDNFKIKNVYTYYMPEKGVLINPPNSNSKLPNEYTDKYDYLDDYLKQILDDYNKLYDD